MSTLALILFLPWFAVLGTVFWHLPRETPRSRARSRRDAAALVLAVAASIAGMRLGLAVDTAGHHPIWAQVLATLYAYGAFLGVLAVSAMLRPRPAAQSR